MAGKKTSATELLKRLTGRHEEPTARHVLEEYTVRLFDLLSGLPTYTPPHALALRSALFSPEFKLGERYDFNTTCFQHERRPVYTSKRSWQRRNRGVHGLTPPP